MTGAFLWDCDGSVNRRRETGGSMLELPPGIVQRIAERNADA
jgi:hypothetical protein